MGLPERVPSAERVRGHQNEVDMIGHQAIGQHLRPATAAGLGEQAAVLRVVLILEKRRLASIAPLCHVVRQSRHNHPRKSCHAAEETSTPVFPLA